MTRTYIIQNDELQHYGRLGMKWGQHIYGKDKAFQKSTEKLGKLDRRITVRRNRSDMQKARSDQHRERSQFIKDKFIKFPVVDRIRTRHHASRASRNARRSYRSLRASQRDQRRAKSFVKNMNKEFTDMKLTSITNEQLELSRKYVIDALEEYKKNN